MGQPRTGPTNGITSYSGMTGASGITEALWTHKYGTRKEENA